MPELSELLRDAAIAQRCADLRPECELLAYRRVIRPLFRLTLRVLVSEKKALPPILRYALRALGAGLTTAQDIAGFLGLERSVLDAALGNLLDSGDVFVNAPDGTRTHRLMLTEQGRQTLQNLSMQVTAEVEIPVIVDGLTHRIVMDYRDEELIKAQELRDTWLPELAPHPRRYKPSLEEIRADLPAVFRKYQASLRGARREVIAVVDIERIDRRFRDDTIAMFYRTPEGPGIEVEIAVEGRTSEPHGNALRESDQARESGMVPARLEAAGTLLAQALGGETLSRMPDRQETGVLRTRLEVAEEEVARLQEQMESEASPREKEAVAELLGDALANRASLRASLGAHDSRWLEVYEHPLYLQEALKTSQERIMILCPWIRREAVDDAFLKLLKSALGRNAAVYIGYGRSGSERHGTSQEALKLLEQLARTHKALHVRAIADIPPCMLVCDQRFAIVSAFNWLSLQAGPRLPIRDERGVLLQTPDLVEQCFADWIPHFE